MESFNLQDWTRIGAMNRKGAAASASASWSAAVLCRFANAIRWRKRQRTAALQDLAEHLVGSWKASASNIGRASPAMNRVRTESARERLGLRRRSLRSRRFGLG